MRLIFNESFVEKRGFVGFVNSARIHWQPLDAAEISFQLHPNVHLVAFAFTQLLGNCYVSIRISSTIIFRLFYTKNLLFLFYIPTSQNSLFLTDMVTGQDGFLLMSTLSIVKFSVLVNKPPTGIFSMIGVWVKGIVGATWGI